MLSAKEGGIGSDFSPLAPDRAQAGVMEGRDLNVGAGRLIPGASPLFAKSGNQPVDGGAIDADRPILTRQIAQILECLSARAGQMKRSSRTQQGRVASRPVGIEHRLGSQAQPPLRRVSAKARLPKGRRTPRRMPAAKIFRFHDQYATVGGEARGKARPGDAAPDNQDIRALHPSGWLRFGKARRLEVL